MDPRLGIYVSSRVGVPFAGRMAMIRDAGFGATCLWWEEEREEARRLRHLAPDIVRKNGATEVYAACSHPVLSGSAVQHIEEAPIKELMVTDTIPLTPDKDLPKITVLSVAPLLGEAIRRIHTGQSVGALFNSY